MITLSFDRILWLPSEYRPPRFHLGTWANYGDTIVIGRVVFDTYDKVSISIGIISDRVDTQTILLGIPHRLKLISSPYSIDDFFL